MALPLRELNPTLEEAEDAILAALREDATIAAYVKSVSSFQGTFEQALQEASLAGDPAFLVMMAGIEFDERGPLEHVAVVEWHVIVRARNLRGNAYQRKPSAAGEVGTYQMVQDVLRVLTTQDLDLDGMAAISPAGVELLQANASRDRSLSAYLVVFFSELDHRVVEPGDEDLITEVGATYEVRTSDGTFVEVATETIEMPGDE